MRTASCDQVESQTLAHRFYYRFCYPLSPMQQAFLPWVLIAVVLLWIVASTMCVEAPMVPSCGVTSATDSKTQSSSGYYLPNTLRNDNIVAQQQAAAARVDSVECAAWRCSCQEISNVYGVAHAVTWGRLKPTDPRAQWWRESACTTSPVQSAVSARGGGKASSAAEPRATPTAPPLPPQQDAWLAAEIRSPSGVPLVERGDSDRAARRVSYAPLGLDRIVDQIMLGRRGGFYVDAYSAAKTSGSMTLMLERERGWSGAVVIPEPTAFAGFVALRRNAYAARCCLAGAAASSQSHGGRCADVSTLLRVVAATAAGARAGGVDASHVDFFALDVGGAELAVLQEWQRASLRPTVDVWSVAYRSNVTALAALRALFAGGGSDEYVEWGPATWGHKVRDEQGTHAFWVASRVAKANPDMWLLEDWGAFDNALRLQRPTGAAQWTPASLDPYARSNASWVYVSGKFGHAARFAADARRQKRTILTQNIFPAANVHVYSTLPPWVLRNPRWKRHTGFVKDPKHESARGGGFWFWKGPLIAHHLKAMPEGAYLVYADVDRPDAAHIPLLIDDMSQNAGNDIALTRLGFFSRNWAKADTYAAFGYTLKETYADQSRQFQGGDLVLRNSPRVRAFIDAWQACVANWHLVSDEPSVLPNAPGFVETRHDQTLLTLLLSTNTQTLRNATAAVKSPYNSRYYYIALKDQLVRPNV